MVFVNISFYASAKWPNIDIGSKLEPLTECYKKNIKLPRQKAQK